jgi:hypothetical protein
MIIFQSLYLTIVSRKKQVYILRNSDGIGNPKLELLSLIVHFESNFILHLFEARTSDADCLKRFHNKKYLFSNLKVNV